MAETAGRRPDYNVSAITKDNAHKGRVGAAWINSNGTISIKLDPFVVLSAIDNLTITLFEVDGKRPTPGDDE